MSRAYLLHASSRKGTHLVQTALAQHPDVRNHYQPSGIPNFLPECTGDELFHHLFGGDSPVAVLSAVWKSGSDRYPNFWRVLRENHVGVISLHRRNMLQWFVSFRLAEATGVWWDTKQQKPSNVQVVVDLADFFATVERDRRTDREVADWFVECKTLHLWYEDMAADYDRTMDEVQRFMELVPHRIRPRCHKQQTRPLSRVIANYSEVESALKGTPYESCLEDTPCRSVQPVENENE